MTRKATDGLALLLLAAAFGSVAVEQEATWPAYALGLGAAVFVGGRAAERRRTR